ncbi:MULTISPECIES: hypothetical protein [unclassified Micromonospora]|uniref:hypothetical protein n=1 Tax=unclassified Micromonospora TaxID=2617518 RepID=UPI0024165D95|nr:MULTISPECIES: hypothetical protein [unclassified Micromonospora]MDG4817005.1 hypothetical protein [Micromonospora sp. WMMD956]WFE59581.1 hypothetical protein O7633_23220 [Micromonospora sp. WMMD712]
MPDSTTTLPDVDPRNRDNLVGFFTDRQAAAMWRLSPSGHHTRRAVLPMDRAGGIEAR